ncbi:hypothetical protein GCM10023084_21150 [Streptomyces lacrimifluminis]|uniref:Uncharacterized protein n=1 Tax=Streptomyces lacrimifluminis TaxID=1500077 RepID=A0A917NWB5_9ACTN|nr:hypothetical protein [Streptomyces lacrimifluminis]GGJ35524.1 hypothetical protein GCM10012282_35360 [Streptomyces lacrimifluminis]
MSDNQSDGKPSEEFEPSVPDDVWEQFTRDTERDIRASAQKEPSARARMVTERLRQQDARGERPAGWRTDPGRQKVNDRAVRRRRGWVMVGVPLAIAVAVVAMKPSLLPGDPFGSARSDGTSGTAPLPEETAAPSTPPPAADPDVPTLARPFAGSPAEQYADGAAGIVLPPAKALGSLSKAQVERALRQTRQLLIVANLDSATLRGGRPEAALKVIDPTQKDLLGDLNTALRRPDEKHDPLSMFSRFNPAEVRLTGHVIKTRGRMTFEAGERDTVVVHADYTFVYPLVRADAGATEVARTIVRRVLEIELYDPAKYQVTPGKISVVRHRSSFGNSDCEVFDGYFHPHFDSDAATAGANPGPTIDPYDRSDEVADGRCGTATRT